MIKSFIQRRMPTAPLIDLNLNCKWQVGSIGGYAKPGLSKKILYIDLKLTLTDNIGN